MNGELVGTWMVDRNSHAFLYDQSWLNSPRCRSLSLSLPISSSHEIKGDVVKNYFDNLLPDNQKIRARLGKRFNAKSDTFGLLQAIGRDCVGAVQLLPENTDPGDWNRIDCDPLSTAQIAELLRSVPSDSSPSQEDDLFRISIAGAQEKTALTRWNGEWCRPHGSTPTTHIFKLPLGAIATKGVTLNASDSVYNEWLCAQIVTELGLGSATTSIGTFEKDAVLIVERFDRAWMDEKSWIARLPQEDFCQALGIPPEKKYEQHGGPGIAKCLQLLQGSQDKNDTIFFLLTQLSFFLLAAIDGHAKNYSIFLQRGDDYEMTPLYDILSAWPYIGNGKNQLSWHEAGLAMALRSKNAHYHFKDIRPRHWKDLALKNGGPEVWSAMIELAAGVEEALAIVEKKLPPDFPVHTWDSISTGMKNAAQRFLSTDA
ncbi:HipA domain-containing protein [Janthinobacterium sp. 78]|uniref:HipA domain-containing protein n=1 Tax=Janthinobacterium sp. 78 TaxID=2135631 RepID=UPI000E30DEDD|nr:HipA domain-containing protein [Janthinobacterium sp. 78]